MRQFKIGPAKCGGFCVTEERIESHQASYNLFAGTLQECLDFVKKQFEDHRFSDTP